MRVLFIGGTGRLSSDVAKISVEMGYDVTLLTRGSKERKKFIDKRYELIYADIRNVDECKEKLKDKMYDVVIDFLSYNVDQLKLTLDIVYNHFNQYIFISSATAYEKQDENEIINENTKVGNRKWGYAYEKYLCEQYLKDYFRDIQSKYYTIIRPYVTYNETRVPYPIVPQNPQFEYSLIERIKNDKSIPIVGDSFITTITYSSDFARGLVGLFENSNAYNNDFHITSEEEVKWSDVLRIIGNYYNKNVKTKNFNLEEFSNKYKLYGEILEGDKGHQMRFNNDKIKSVVKDFQCEVSLEDGINRVIDFYENNLDYRKIDYYWYGRLDKICGDVKEKKFLNCDSKIKYLMGYYMFPELLVKILRKVGFLR